MVARKSERRTEQFMFFVLGMGQLPPHIYRSISIWTQPIMDTYRRCSAEGQWDASYKWPNELWRTTITRIHDTNKEKWKSRLIFYFMLSVWFFLFEFFLFFFFFLFNQNARIISLSSWDTSSSNLYINLILKI